MKLNFLDLLFLLALSPWVIKPVLTGNLSSGFSKLYVIIMAAYFTFFWFSSTLVINLVSEFVQGKTAVTIASIVLTFIVFFILIKLLLFIIDLIIGALSISYLDKIISGILGLITGIFFILLLIFWLDSYKGIRNFESWSGSYIVNKARGLDSGLDLKNKIQNLNNEQKKIRSEFE